MSRQLGPTEVKRLFDEIERRDQRVELNLYLTGYEDDAAHAAHTDEPTPLHPEPPTESERS